MIAHIRGRLCFKNPESVIVDVNGVGYKIYIPLSTFYNLPDEGKEVFLYTFQYVAENNLDLYGFLTEDEKELFIILLKIGGIGPKLARNILSGITKDELKKVISDYDVKRLTLIPGVGRKTAERLILELKNFFKIEEKRKKKERKEVEEAISALKELGFKSSEAEEAVLSVLNASKDYSLENLIKKALKFLSKKS